MKKKFLFKLTFVVILIFVILNLLALVLDYNIRKSNIFKVNIIFNQDLPKNIILGSSRSLTGINTKVLSDKTNEKWYNLAMDDTRNETHYLFYKLLCEVGKKPRNILIQYDQDNIEIDSITFFGNDYQLLPFINNSVTIDEYFKSKNNYFFYKYFPIFKYIEFNNELFFPSLLLLIKPNYQHRFDEFGDYNYPNDMILSEKSMEVSEKRVLLKNEIMVDFLDRSEADSFNLIVFTAPIYRTNVVCDTIIKRYKDFSSLYSSNLNFADEFHISNNSKIGFTEIISDWYLSLGH